ncbi:MAG: hypothetical protein ACOX52_08375 [Verrucomicrobiota bacterium]|jgi:hypothetical protein
MEPDRAIEIVRKLADGVDPFTDERFPASSPYQQADTVRALHLAIEGLAKLKRSTARKTGPGRPWSEEEEKNLLRKFDDKVDVEEIAKEHEPTKGAIWARLEKLGRIQRKDFPGSTPHPPRSGAAPEPTPATGNMSPPTPEGNDDYPF